MKRPFSLFLLLFITGTSCFSQDVALLSSKMFDVRQQIFLSEMNGWIFKEGNDPAWANDSINTTSWTKLNPTQLSSKFADENGRIEGWFRFRFKLDADFAGIPLGIRRGGWAATDIYLDGQLVSSFGNTGRGNNFREYNPIEKSSTAIKLQIGNEHILAIHFVDYLSPLPPFDLRSASTGGVRLETQGLKYLLFITAPEHDLFVSSFSNLTLFYRSIWIAVTVLLALLFWLLVFINRGERKILLMISICSTFAVLSNLPRFFLTDKNISFAGHLVSELVLKLSYSGLIVTSFAIVLTIFRIKIPLYLRRMLLTYAGIIAASIFFVFHSSLLRTSVVAGLFLTAIVLVTSWKKLKGAQWAIVGGVTLSTAFGVAVNASSPLYSHLLLIYTGFYYSFPLSLVVYVSLRFKEIVGEVQNNARLIVQMTEEKKEQAVKQQKILEQEVARQTAELRTALADLKSAQSQLVQSEKMASLGELTAGIAHEIQNPLNFVNNFSEVNKELLVEMTQEIKKGNLEGVNSIAKDIIDNQEKINHHGKRADSIVKGMLQHSRNSTGQKELTDINTLCDEYLRLAYHGLRAKDKSFNVKYETDFDASLPRINVVPQEIGRVILNLINNAFYAVSERARFEAAGYVPQVKVSTKNLNDRVEIQVKDNGRGIPENVRDKIFQPFFTTKPAGQGTGLGLSLAYDIITKGHGGELKVESTNKAATFIIHLPIIQI